MPTEIQQYELIETEQELGLFYKQNEDVGWLAFDTEFVGEKRFLTRLCLIQVATEKGNYLIDPFKVKNLDPFIDLLSNSKIKKITHAGDNDYRLLNSYFGTLPKNVFDTQIAAAFVGYKYPVSFRKLVDNELQINLSKGYAVADWESRPFRKSQLKYALNDVLHLYSLWKSLEKKLNDRNRLHWAEEEFQKLEMPEYFEKDPNQEALNSNLIKSLSPQEQVFLIRLFAWRRDLAEKKDYSKEMVLPGKMIAQVVKSIQAGKDALTQNRRIPPRISNGYGDVFEQLFRKAITDEERNLIKSIKRNRMENPKKELLIELLYLLMKYKCLDYEISPGMVFPKNFLYKVKDDPKLAESMSENGWRKELLGATFMNWLKNINQLEMDINEGKIKLDLSN